MVIMIACSTLPSPCFPRVPLARLPLLSVEANPRWLDHIFNALCYVEGEKQQQKPNNMTKLKVRQGDEYDS